MGSYNKGHQRFVNTNLVGIVDCNNFYASCETIFRPDLVGKPIIVLSNNDGCIIARSEESKRLGIKMGEPYHLIEDLCTKQSVNVFSSNYTLYGDISARIMSILRELVPAVEEYSVDEAFIDLGNMPYHSIPRFCTMVRQKIKQGIGITVSIGVANSKTLAKVANRYAKKHVREIGVYVLDNDIDTMMALEATPVGDVWGVGRQFTKLLINNNITNALELAVADAGFVKKYMHMPGLRMHRELNGFACIPLELAPQAKQTILNSRSFGKSLTEPEDIKEAIAYFVGNVGEKLRSQKSSAGFIDVFIQTNRFKVNEKQLYNSARVFFDIPTNNTPELIKIAFLAFDRIFRKGYNIKKAGVMLGDFVPEDQLQTNLFETPDPEENAKMRKVMKLMDDYNSRNGNVIKLGEQITTGNWKMRQQKKSPNRTTSLLELLEVDIDKI